MNVQQSNQNTPQANTISNLDSSTVRFLGEYSNISNIDNGSECISCQCPSTFSACNEGPSMPNDNSFGRNLGSNDVYAKRKKKVEDMLLITEGFNQLSVQEREFALDELHGVIKPIDETSTANFVENAIEELNFAMTKIKKHRSAYDMALFLNPSYVQNREFLRMFLRGERYDIKKAATKLVKHFEIKLELFGFDCLVRDITLSDLNDDEVEMYMSAGYFFTNSYDRSGRRLFLYSTERAIYKEPINLVREKISVFHSYLLTLPPPTSNFLRSYFIYICIQQFFVSQNRCVLLGTI